MGRDPFELMAIFLKLKMFTPNLPGSSRPNSFAGNPRKISEESCLVKLVTGRHLSYRIIKPRMDDVTSVPKGAKSSLF